MSDSPAQVPERESMEFDVVIAGAGPAGLAAAIRLKQLAQENNRDISVVVLEKGSEVGAHILSGAVIDPVGLDALIPDWRERGADLSPESIVGIFTVFNRVNAIGGFRAIGHLSCSFRWNGDRAPIMNKCCLNSPNWHGKP